MIKKDTKKTKEKENAEKTVNTNNIEPPELTLSPRALFLVTISVGSSGLYLLYLYFLSKEELKKDPFTQKLRDTLDLFYIDNKLQNKLRNVSFELFESKKNKDVTLSVYIISAIEECYRKVEILLEKQKEKCNTPMLEIISEYEGNLKKLFTFLTENLEIFQSTLDGKENTLTKNKEIDVKGDIDNFFQKELEETIQNEHTNKVKNENSL